jgi:hypothetical protein
LRVVASQCGEKVIFEELVERFGRFEKGEAPVDGICLILGHQS